MTASGIDTGRFPVQTNMGGRLSGLSAEGPEGPAEDIFEVCRYSRDDLNRLLDKLLMERALSEAAQAQTDCLFLPGR